MRALFYVFTGTGNTKKVAERLAEEWRALGHEADVALIRAGSEYPDAAAYDLLAIGYPVHAFNAPAPVLAFCKKMPRSAKKPVYFFKTSGEPVTMNDASVILPRRILKRRGYDVRGEFHFVMPYNIIFRHSDEMAARMWRDAELLAARYAREMSEGARNKKGVNVFKRMAAFTLRIEHTAMPVIGHRFKPTEACVGCGACEKKCPQGNISMKDGKPFFAHSCAGCMACAFSCPKDALKISLLNGWRVNGAYSFAGVPADDGQVCKYCRKAYLRYFHRAEEKTES